MFESCGRWLPMFHMKFRARVFTGAISILILLIYFNSKLERKPKKILRLTGETIDNSAQYRIVRFYKSTPRNDIAWNFYDVTIATQCSVNHLHHLVELANRWNGPISCAVFVPSKDASYADDAITLLRQCFPAIKSYVEFHFVYPSVEPSDLNLKGSWLSLSCTELLDKLQNYGYQNYLVGNLPFPHNVLRNVARSGTLTEYELLIDIDIMPNIGLRTQLLQFLVDNSLFGNENDKTVFVLPVFEVKNNHLVPNDKDDLIQGVNNGIVRPFHNETCWWCHKLENYNLWRTFKQTDQFGVCFYAKWDKSWEPFYVSHRSVPLYDERFKQYGFDRIQQICELHIAGYEFAILNNAFLVHYGWKYKGEFYANKDDDNSQNWILFNYHFKDNLQEKYNTTRTCSPLEKWLPPNKRRALGVENIKKGSAVIKKFEPNIVEELKHTV